MLKFKFLNKNKYLPADIAEYEKMKNPKPILFVKNLTKKYFGRKKPAISNLNFAIYPGTFHAFIGANGAGKTTTIKSIIGAYCNWSGTILINGIKNSHEDAKKHLGYIPESTRFPINLSAYQYIKWMLRLSGFSPKEAAELTTKSLNDCNMWNLKDKDPNGFSSGQKKKILLAQALAHNPDIIIMDEPVANLDPQARADFFHQINELKKQGKAIFVSSHVLAELDMYFDSLTILDGGKIVFSGTKEQLNKQFTTNEYVVSTNNNAKVLAFLKTKKIKYRLLPEETIAFDSSKQQNILAVQQFLMKNKLIIYNFSISKLLLSDVYDKLIINGSIDTMPKK